MYYNKRIPNYFRFVAVEDSSILLSGMNMENGEPATDIDLQYSKDGSTWTQYEFTAIPLSAGETLYMKGNNPNGFSIMDMDTGGGVSYYFGDMSGEGNATTGKYECHGNIMSLLYGDDFEDKTTIPSAGCFYGLFMECDGLVNAPELPATTLTDYCYSEMFQGCCSLVTAPELPVNTLAEGCYFGMFQGCTSLVTAPALPATTLVGGCYSGMFHGCTSLVNAPELPATTLSVYCYSNMFASCTSLVNVPELPATTLAEFCYNGMFHSCTSLVNAPELPATTLADGCYDSMFNYCTSLVNAPELPAITLAYYCYSFMFYGCSNLNNITMLATDISALGCLFGWVDGVASTGTFYRNENMTSLPTGVDGIPEGWEVIPPLPVPISLCDIAYWNGSAVKTVSKDKWSTSLGTPIGVVVIPEGMLPDGKTRMVGLKPVDASGNPSSSHVGMAWGIEGTNTSLTDYSVVPTTDNAGSTSTGSNVDGSLPSDKFTGATSYVDSAAKYTSWEPYIPSPYLYNGGELRFNPEYSKAISGYNNALSDFNGLSNTETLVGLGSEYEAANAAWQYSDGVSNTQWYLPAAGELGFLMPRFNEINSALTSIGGVAVGSMSDVWSSSEATSDYAYHLNTHYGLIFSEDKEVPYFVIVFGIV